MGRCVGLIGIFYFGVQQRIKVITKSMSRFIKPPLPSENAYVEFKFQHSLRKYEQKPIKKIKCNELCGNCVHHHKKKNPSVSPYSQRYNPAQPAQGSKQCPGSIDRQSAKEKMEDSHLVSSNKSIKLSRRKPLEDMSQNQKNNLQMKIYESLVNISKGESKVDKSQEGKSELEEEVFLNDFEVSDGMDEEQENEADEDFGRIEISEKSGLKQRQWQEKDSEIEECEEESKAQQEMLENIVEQKDQIPLQSCEVQCKDIEQEECLSARIQKLSVRQEDEQNEPIQSLSNQPPIKSFLVQSAILVEEVLIESPLIEEEAVPELPEHIAEEPHSHNSQQHPQDSSELHSELPSPSEINPFLRTRPVQSGPVLSSKIIESSNLSDSMMSKCLVFQGGRIYIDAQGQNFYISVRVFNKLRKQCSSIDDLIAILIHQRPYLETKKSQIKNELEHYLHDDA